MLNLNKTPNTDFKLVMSYNQGVWRYGTWTAEFMVKNFEQYYKKKSVYDLNKCYYEVGPVNLFTDFKPTFTLIGLEPLLN